MRAPADVFAGLAVASRVLVALAIAAALTLLPPATGRAVPSTGVLPEQVPELPDPNVPAHPLSVRASRGAVALESFGGVHYGRVFIAGPTVVEITSATPIQTFEVLPSRLGLQPVVRGRTLRMTLDRVRDVAVRIDAYEPLYLFADTVVATPSSRGRARREPGRSVTQFGADPTGRRISTTALQNAINAVAGSGDTLRVPAGLFRTGALMIRGAMTLMLASGARIQGSDKSEDYPVPPGSIEPIAGRTVRGATALSSCQLIQVTGNDVTITGRGTIDGAGQALRRAGRTPMLLRVQDAQRVLIEGVVLRNPAGWNSHVLRCADVTFRRVRLLGDRGALNNDGIDPDGSHRVTIDRCLIDTGDDAVAVKATGHGGPAWDVEDVTVKECLLRTRKSAMKVGTESRCAFMRRIEFIDNDVLEADRSISLYCRDRARFENILFEGNRVEGWTPGGTAQLIDAEVRPRDGPPGTISGVRVRRMWVSEPAPVASSLRGLDPMHPIADVRFEGLTIGDRVCANAGDVPLRVNLFVGRLAFTPSP